MQRIYLDNAATSWPKPESVYGAMDDYARNSGVPWGRTTGQLSEDIYRLIAQLRVDIRRLVGGQQGDTIFGFNCTDVLNLGILGTVQDGDHVVTTVSEHNSVLRPLRHLEEQGTITVTRVECDETGQVHSGQVLDAVQANTRMVCMIHSSNVTGVTNDVGTVGDQLQNEKPLFLVDAAQSIGCQAINFDEMGIDLLAGSGHKGLMGPLGTGVLVTSPKAQEQLRPIRFGGTGASSDSDHHPADFPGAYEAGNLNVPGLIGLQAGLDYLQQKGVESVRAHKEMLAVRFVEEVSSLESVQLITPLSAVSSGLVSFKMACPANELAAILDSTFGIQIRAGYHCASLIHSRVGSRDGCARVSFGLFNNESDVDQIVEALRQIAAVY